MTALASDRAALDRAPAEWVDDMRWHRHMFAESRFRWVPEDATHILLTYTRGRCVFETPSHLRFLDQQQRLLRDWKGQIQDAMAVPLRSVRSRLAGERRSEGLRLVGLDEYTARVIIGSAITPDPAMNPDVRRALRGIPLPNPLSQVWELRQMCSMYQAVDDMLEDLYCDLALELAPHHGWANLAAVTSDSVPRQLQWRVERQRQLRGEPGDSRRRVEQRY